MICLYSLLSVWIYYRLPFVHWCILPVDIAATKRVTVSSAIFVLSGYDVTTNNFWTLLNFVRRGSVLIHKLRHTSHWPHPVDLLRVLAHHQFSSDKIWTRKSAACIFLTLNLEISVARSFLPYLQFTYSYIKTFHLILSPIQKCALVGID